jgi:ERCC4-type nuclease
MNIIVDYREGTLQKKFEKIDQKNITYQNLNIGDIQIISNNHNISVFERKSINDLKCSLTDGRFREQKARILSSDFIHKCYIFEGRVDKEFEEIFVQIVIRLQMKYHMLVFLTDDEESTCNLINTCVKKCEKDESYFIHSSQHHHQCNYIDTLKLSKKENLTPEICFVLQLAQIPLISKKIAGIIASCYPNWTELIYILRNNIEEFKERTKDAKLGKKKIESLMNYTFMSIGGL